ncbi:hypothetical protein DITRI_Ditri09bG0026800 [Diplodiscus trichospermus]
MQTDSSEVSFCPSFNSYYSDKKLVDFAAGGGGDFQGGVVSDDDEFEFVNNDLWESPNTLSFPIFNRDLLLKGGDEDHDYDVEEAIRIPLRNLFIGDVGDMPPSSSSSEADELEGVPPEMYCVWKPKQLEELSPNRCKKSKSTGSSSSTRWRVIKDLLKRCNSDSKVSPASSFFILNFDKNTIEKTNEEKANTEKTATTTTMATKNKSEGEVANAKKMKRVEKTSPYEVFYVRNKALKEGDKRRSYLPYRQALVGIFSNANGLRSTSPPF